jgi:hypothetical protein
MPNQLIALITELTAKRASFVSIRHSPGFGIAAIGLNRYAVTGRLTFQTITSHQ